VIRPKESSLRCPQEARPRPCLCPRGRKPRQSPECRFSETRPGLIKACLPALVLILVVVLFGCAPRGVKTPPAGKPVAAATDPLFAEAEDLFVRGKLAAALEAYRKYLDLKPRGRYAAWALRRTAAIYRRQGRPGLALEAYRRFERQFGNSPMAEQVRIEMLGLLLEQERYADVIDGASRMLDKTTNRSSLRNLWSLLARAYSAIGDAADAAYYYHKLLTAPAGVPDKDEVRARLQAAIDRLSRSEAEMLLDAFDDPFSRSRLMFRLAQTFIDENLYDEALDVLKKFRELYPQHPLAGKVQAMADDLEKRFVFEPFTVGCLLPLSGPYKIYGQRALEGIELALDQVAGRLGKQPFRLLVKDTGADPGRAVEAVQELVQQKVGVIIGPAFTADAAAAMAQQLQVPMIALTQKAGVPETGRYVFRNFMTPAMQVKALVTYAVEKLDLRRFAVLYPDDNYGNTFMELFWDQVIASGGQVVGVESYRPDQTDFAEPISRLTGTYYSVPEDLKRTPLVRVEKPPELPLESEQRRGPLGRLVADFTTLWTGLYWDETLGRGDKRSAREGKKPLVDFEALFIPDSAKTAGMILPQLAYYDVNDVFLLGTNLWHSDSLIELAGKYARKAVIVDGFFAGSAYRPVKRFVQRFVSVYGRRPGVIEAFAYDTAAMVMRILADPALKLRFQVQRRLAAVFDDQAVTGPTVFDPSGEARKPLYLLRIKGKRFVELAHP